MKLLVLAGGFGTRLKSAVSDVPKGLAPVNGVPILRLQIENWIHQGLASFVFLLHHEAHLVIDFLEAEMHGLLKKCEVDWIVESGPMGTGGAIANAVSAMNLSGSFLVTNADTWLGNGIQALAQAGSPAMAVVRVEDARRFGGVRFDDRNVVSQFVEKSALAQPGWINAGLYHLDPTLFKGWDAEPFSLETERLVSWSNQGILKAMPIEADFIDIGIPDDYFRFCRWMESQRASTL
jgi:NDP-sugar pyrophosphorylase family protein